MIVLVKGKEVSPSRVFFCLLSSLSHLELETSLSFFVSLCLTRILHLTSYSMETKQKLTKEAKHKPVSLSLFLSLLECNSFVTLIDWGGTDFTHANALLTNFFVAVSKTLFMSQIQVHFHCMRCLQENKTETSGVGIFKKELSCSKYPELFVLQVCKIEICSNFQKRNNRSHRKGLLSSGIRELFKDF